MSKLTEKYNSDPNSITQYNYNGKANQITKIVSKTQPISKNFPIFSIFISIIKTMLLPVGYPNSVTPEYIKFQVWDTLQECCGYFKNILTSQAWISALGVGDANATVINAIALTMGIDYIKMIIGVCLGVPRLTRLFSSDMKQWRMVAEVLVVICNAFLLGAKAFPKYFLTCLIINAVLETIAGICGNISRAPLIRHLALKKNESDVAAKEGNQSRMLKLVVIIGGYFFLIYVNNDVKKSFCAYFFLAVLKIYFQYKATIILELRTLNLQRTELLFNCFVTKNFSNMTKSYIAKNESIIYDFKPKPEFSKIYVGVCIEEVLECQEKMSFEENEMYCLGINYKKKNINIALREDADSLTELKAVLHGLLWRKMFIDLNNNTEKKEFVMESYREINKNFEKICEILDLNGWEKSDVVFQTDLYRYLLKK